MAMSSATIIWMFLTFCSIGSLPTCQSYLYDKAKVVTYGEPCAASRQFPIVIEERMISDEYVYQGPKTFVKEEKIPVSLDFKAVSEIFVQAPRSRRIEYPIGIEAARPAQTVPSSFERMTIVDPLRGKSYAYDTHVPSAGTNLPSLSNNYNFAVDVPLPSKKPVAEQSEEKCAPRLKGLASRVDRILVPACDVLSPRMY